MKVSQLIERLEEFKLEHGDLFVVAYPKYDIDPTPYIALDKIDYDTSGLIALEEIVVPACFIRGGFE